MSGKLVHVRRSTRDGRRKSTRLKPKKRRKLRPKTVPDFYDRDLGGYKFVSLHKDHLWHPTIRSNLQEQEEKELCQQLENCADKLDKEGYGMDDFFVDDEEDEEETIAKEETDIIFQMASTQRWSDSDETDLSDIDEYE